MNCELKYGAGASLRLEIDEHALVANCDAPRGAVLADVSTAVDRALGQPLDFPPLAQSAVPGDKVVLGLADEVPHAATIVERVIRALVASGVEPGSITVLRTPNTAATRADDPLAQLSDDLRSAVDLKIHDPLDRDSLSYLAATAEGKPIYINRSIHDADLVISIGCLRLPESAGYFGIHAGLFPAFSDAASLSRYRSAQAVRKAQSARLRKETDEVCWLLGMRFTIQVVPAPAGEVLHVLAGDLDAVEREGTRRCDEAWRYEVPRRADLVVATLGGEAAEQTWEKLARALDAASRAAGPEGAIVVCSELSQPPPDAIRSLSGADDLEGLLRAIDRHQPPGAATAARLVRALQNGDVYLV
ncbi:MAG TPA: lactate racemase domain-containing protein, partial [Pirellulales bacterium]|nr:lactate racemase domain-containing protein [Pirellulales bacterium]